MENKFEVDLEYKMRNAFNNSWENIGKRSKFYIKGFRGSNVELEFNDNLCIVGINYNTFGLNQIGRKDVRSYFFPELKQIDLTIDPKLLMELDKEVNKKDIIDL